MPGLSSRASGINMEKKFNINGKEVSVQNFKSSSEVVSFTLDGKAFSFNLVDRRGPDLVLEGERRFQAHIGALNQDGEAMIIADGREAILGLVGKKKKKSEGAAGTLSSPMPGKIFKLIKQEGEEVKKGETILILEAMKMEHSIRSDKDGKIKKIFFETGELVQGGVTLAEVE